MNKQIIVFSGVVIRNNRILMLQRHEPECKEAHMKWEFPGGKVEFNETPEKSLKREIFEETGVKVKIEKLLPIIQTVYWDYDWGKQQTICMIYLCKFVSKSKVPKDHHVEQIKWFSVEEAKKLDSLPGTDEALNLILL